MIRGNLPLYAPDKTEKKLAVKVRTVRLITKRAKAAGITFSALANAILDKAVERDPWTAEDEDYLHEQIKRNLAKREAMKSKRKGIAK